MKFYTDQRSCSSGIATYTRAYLGLCLAKRAAISVLITSIAQCKQLSLFNCFCFCCCCKESWIRSKYSQR